MADEEVIAVCFVGGCCPNHCNKPATMFCFGTSDKEKDNVEKTGSSRGENYGTSVHAAYDLLNLDSP